jgi:hypothetical protein
MREQGLGVSEKDYGTFNGYAPTRLAGKIVLRVEKNGEAYYVHPSTRKLHFLGRPTDAFNVMRSQGLGISTANLKSIVVARGYDISDVQQKDTSVVVSPVTETIFQYCERNSYFIASASRDAKCVEIEQAYFKKVGATDEQIEEWLKSVGRLDEIEDEREVVVNTSQEVSETIAVNEPTQASHGDLGPDIRVGLFYSEDPQKIRNTQSFEVQDRYGKTLQTVPANTVLTIDYDEETGKYVYGSQKTSSYLRFVTKSDTSVFEVVTFERRPEWNPSLNDNVFLGDLELRYNSSKDRTWIINELPMENYLKGIAETSNSSPEEYHKTMAVASRTYASYHLERGTKHGDEYYIVDATYDQVYKGYGTQQRLSNVVRAVEATRGEIVTYKGELALTPYYSWSDGRTRSMLEVWGVDKPWLQSVKEPEGYTKTTLYGHGVGLSAHGAVLLAHEYNYDYDEILAYYYTGTTITDNYNNLF